MHHDLVGVLRCVACVALAPVVANGVGKDVSRMIEGRCGDASTSGGISLESVLSNTVPEVECSIGTSGAESAVMWVE